MKKILLSSLLCLSIFFSGCAAHGSSASFAHQFVTYKGNTYVLQSETVSGSDIGQNIGSIKYYSTDERVFRSDSFSNYYKAGTSLYSIKDVDVNDAIAVEEARDRYVKLANSKE